MKDNQSKRQLAAIKTRKKIVEATRKLLSQKGFEAVSISDITKEAKVSTGSFYTYFKKKEDIISELNKSDFYILAKTVSQMTDKSLIEKLEFYCRNFLLGIERAGIEICRQWIRNNIKPLPMPESPEFTKYEYDNRQLHSVFESAVQSGELSSDFPLDDFTLQVNAHLYGLMTVWCMSECRIIGSEQIECYITEVLSPALKPFLKT